MKQIKGITSMDQTTYTIPVMVDKKIYRDFALFNCFKRQKSYRSPAIFTGSFLLFAAVFQGAAHATFDMGFEDVGVDARDE